MQQSIFKNYVFQLDDYPSNDDIIRSLNNGFALSKVDSKKTEPKRFCLHLKLCRVEWYRPMTGYEEFEGFIDFRDIQEIRFANKIVEILYGKKFCLNKFSFKG